MKAFHVHDLETGPRLVDLAEPVPGAGQVLVEIAACGLNFADTLMARGKYQEMPETPFTLGMELAGVVRAHGPGVEQPAIGARVAVWSGHGGLAEAGGFPAERCIPIPDEMSFGDAAAFQIAYGTSHLGLDRRARLRSGETLLVLGAAGGVGLTAVEVGKAMGARVIAVARGAGKLEICRAAGADHVIDSAAEDVRTTVKGLGGADVVYDPVGGALFTAAMRATNPEGRILAVGFASGDVPQIPANHLLVKNIDVLGYWWGGYAHFNPAALRDSMDALFALYKDGALKPHVGHSLPLERVEEAFTLMTARKSTGKIVITMGGQER